MRLECGSLILQAREEFGTECRGKHGCNSCKPSFSRFPASDSYSTWPIRGPAGPYTSFSWFSWVARSVLPTASASCGRLSFYRSWLLCMWSWLSYLPLIWDHSAWTGPRALPPQLELTYLGAALPPCPW